MVSSLRNEKIYIQILVEVFYFIIELMLYKHIWSDKYFSLAAKFVVSLEIKDLCDQTAKWLQHFKTLFQQLLQGCNVSLCNLSTSTKMSKKRKSFISLLQYAAAFMHKRIQPWIRYLSMTFGVPSRLIKAVNKCSTTHIIVQINDNFVSRE